jgi:hypothetical protein
MILSYILLSSGRVFQLVCIGVDVESYQFGKGAVDFSIVVTFSMSNIKMA